MPPCRRLLASCWPLLTPLVSVKEQDAEEAPPDHYACTLACMPSCAQISHRAQGGGTQARIRFTLSFCPELFLLLCFPPSLCPAPLLPAASLDAFDRALSLHRAQQDGIRRRNERRAEKRHDLQTLQDEQGVSEAQALLDELGGDEEAHHVPAKLLNNAAVLKYRFVCVCLN